MGGLGCHGNCIHVVSGGELDEQVGCNHHGNVCQVHFVDSGVLNNLFTELQESLKNKSKSIATGTLISTLPQEPTSYLFVGS